MADKKLPAADYTSLQTELETILAELGRDDLDIDQALKHYERGLVIVQQLERYLDQAENRIIAIKARFDTET
jgi:exodeoxyribonuclease VII small subunit